MTDTERALAREIRLANAALKFARTREGFSSGDDCIRLHYCERWLASLFEVARSLP
jgi:hypothetical protein